MPYKNKNLINVDRESAIVSIIICMLSCLLA